LLLPHRSAVQILYDIARECMEELSVKGDLRGIRLQY
jgi:hypothetical protein